MTTVLGVDGGGRKTYAVVVDAFGTLLGAGAAGPSNWEMAGVDVAFVEEVLANVLRANQRRISIDEIASRIAERLPRNVFFGTSTWSFPDWEGLVYSRRRTTAQLAREGLSEYARHPLLTTVGIDRSFYAPIPRADLERYAGQLPAGFPCCLKAPQAVTSAVIAGPGREGARRETAGPLTSSPPHPLRNRLSSRLRRGAPTLRCPRRSFPRACAPILRRLPRSRPSRTRGGARSPRARPAVTPARGRGGGHRGRRARTARRSQSRPRPA